MRVALISSAYPPEVKGGIEVHSYYLSHELRRKGVEVVVFCAGKHISHFVQDDGVEVWRLPSRLLQLPPSFLWFQVENVRRFQKMLSDFDIVHSQHASGTFYALLKRKLGIPWMVTFHGSWSRNFLASFPISGYGWNFDDIKMHVLGFPFWHAITAVDANFADMRVACSRYLARELSAEYSIDLSGFQVIYNAVNMDLIGEVSPRDLRPAGGPTLLFSGRLTRMKGVKYLLESVAILRRQYPQTRLRIFGEGPMMKDIEKLAATLGIQGLLDMQGRVPHAHLIAQVKQSDVVVFPSISEAQSMGMLEAMACSKPIVAFNLPFAREIIQDGKTGLLARPLDSRDLARRISDILESDDLRSTIGRNAREYIQSHHNWGMVAQQYLHLYRRMHKTN